jgi:hypothetical protein
MLSCSGAPALDARLQTRSPFKALIASVPGMQIRLRTLLPSCKTKACGQPILRAVCCGA